MGTRRLRLLSANIQAGSSTRGYHDYVARSWSHVLPAGNKRGSLDAIADLAARHDIVGLQEADPGSLRSGFTNQTHYLAERAGFAYWTHQPNRRVGGVASSANGLLSRLEPTLVEDHSLPGRVKGRGVLIARCGFHEGNVGTHSAGGCRPVWRYSGCISGRCGSQLKSPISTAFGWPASSSAMNDTCASRDCAPSERWAMATVNACSPSLKRAISTPRPLTRPGSECSSTSFGSSRLNRPLALDATPPTLRLGWWLQ